MSLCEVATPARRRRRCYSLEEANRSLVLIRRIVRDIIRQHGRVVELQELADLTDGRLSPDSQAGQELRATINHLAGLLQELDELNVLLVDYSRGAVDFPSQVDGREVYLSWQCGQQAISAWHEVGQEPQALGTLPHHGRIVLQPQGTPS